MIDVVPELLEKIRKDFQRDFKESEVINSVQKLLDAGTATYKEANDYAEEAGKILAKAFQSNLSSNVLPDGRMYYNIAERILNETLIDGHEMVSWMTEQIQDELNKNAGIGIKSVSPELNQDRVDGLINRLAGEPDFDGVKWLLDEPIVNFHQAIVDDSIKANADFHASAGLEPILHRIASPSCCEWCDSIAGDYRYDEAPDDIYRRHERCRCRVEYDPGEGKRQNVWTKGWS